MIKQSDEALELHHFLPVPLEDAFDAWTTPPLIEEWWGPHGYRTKVIELNAAVGGKFVFEMTGPSGASCLMCGTYTRFDRPHHLAFEVVEHCTADMPQNIEAPSQPSHVEINFEVSGNGTKLILRQTGLAADYRMLANIGWSQSLERVESALRY
ncbi:MAG: SRPBCC domain-containing protein [Pseudomonadota bacterium]